MKKLVNGKEAETLAGIRAANPPRYMTPHALDRLARENGYRQVDVQPVDVLRFAARGRIIEYCDDNDHQRPRVLTESFAGGLRWKVVLDLRSQFVVTCWTNTADDTHPTLDLSRYSSEPIPMDILLADIEKPVVRFRKVDE